MKNSIVFVIVLLILIAIFILVHFFLYDKYKMPKGAEIIVSDKKLEVYDENIYLYDLIKSHNVEILTENVPLQLESTGNQIITISYKYKNSFRHFLYDINYEVIDNISPIFIKATPESKTFYVSEFSEKFKG